MIWVKSKFINLFLKRLGFMSYHKICKSLNFCNQLKLSMLTVCCALKILCN